MVINVLVRQTDMIKYFELCEVKYNCLQINMFLDRLHGDPIGLSVLGIFVIGKNTILTVRSIHSTF